MADSTPVISYQWLPRFLQASDSLITGSYAHSFGLEALIQEGVVHDRATLRLYLLHAGLAALGRLELPLAAHAWSALATPVDWAKLEEISRLASASKSAREARLASENIGRQRANFSQLFDPTRSSKSI